MRQSPNNQKYPPLFSGITLALLLMLQCIVPQAMADDVHKIQLIELKHRSAIEIIAAIKPHLPQGSVASQQGQKLVLSGKASNLEQLVILINALDSPVQAWRVFFAQGQINLQESQQKNTRHYSTARSEIFELLVREGAQARLERGFWVPVKTVSGNENYRASGYEWISSGFWVAVEPVGLQLVLNITTQQAQPNRQNLNPSASLGRTTSFSGRQFESEVALDLGKWTTLGSEAQLAAQIPERSRRYSGGSSNEYYSICIEASNKPNCPR